MRAENFSMTEQLRMNQHMLQDLLVRSGTLPPPTAILYARTTGKISCMLVPLKLPTLELQVEALQGVIRANAGAEFLGVLHMAAGVFADPEGDGCEGVVIQTETPGEFVREYFGLVGLVQGVKYLSWSEMGDVPKKRVYFVGRSPTSYPALS